MDDYLEYAPGRVRSTMWVVGLSGLMASLTGCWESGGMYCQSGPKYGTQCYRTNAVEWPETQVRGATTGAVYAGGATQPTGYVDPSTPSSGCSVVESGGVSAVPAGCVSERQPANGAVR